VGMLIIDGWLDQQDEAMVFCESGLDDFCINERDCLGFDHSEVGALLAERWGFPDSFAQIIANHHDPDHGTSSVSDEIDAMTRTVVAGDLLAGLLANEAASAEDMAKEDDRNMQNVISKLQALGIDPNSIDELRLDLTENLEETLTSATRCTVFN